MAEKRELESYRIEAEEEFQKREEYRKEREIKEIMKFMKKNDDKIIDDEIQKNCPHENIDSYNHGYHRFCKDCGKEM